MTIINQKYDILLQKHFQCRPSGRGHKQDINKHIMKNKDTLKKRFSGKVEIL